MKWLTKHLTKSTTPNTTAAQTPYQAIGGEAVAKAIAHSFYDYMETEPRAAELLAIHPQPMDRIRHVFAQYLTMWLGGPDTYTPEYGHPRLRARHLGFAVTPALKQQWMNCMRKAMYQHVTDIALANRLLSALDQLAEHMINTEQ